VYDKLGNRTEIRFKDIQINLEIPEKTFQFIKPPEAEWLNFTTTP
jgi:outer membrane lipoprotein-sorting protein